MRLGIVFPFVIGFVLVVFLAINPATYMNLDQGTTPAGVDSIGEILEIRGEGLVKSPHQDFFHQASRGQSLIPLHKIVTGFDSKVLVNVGERFWVEPNSQVKVDQEKGKVRVHLLAGSVRRFKKDPRDKKSQSAQFLISGQPQTGMELSRAATPQLSSIPLDEVQLEVADRKQQEVPVGVSQKEIHETFNLQRRFIEKCFIAHYSRANGKTQSGKVWVRFTVASTGDLQSPIVTRSDFKDQTFHSCLKEVVQRVRLKSYRGVPVNVEFPISIELPN